MATTVGMELVVHGGGLDYERPWCPSHAVTVDGVVFLPLSRSDRNLQRYIFGRGRCKDSNAPLASNAFFDELAKVRNRAVDAAIMQYLIDQDPMSTLTSLPKNARQTVDPQDIPRVVDAALPAVELETATETAMYAQRQARFMLNMRRTGLICIEATAENLAHVRAGAMTAQKAADAQPRKRAAPLIDCGVKGVLADKRRKMLSTTCMVNGVKQKFTKKPEVWDHYHINAAAQDLQEEKDDYIRDVHALAMRAAGFEAPSAEGSDRCAHGADARAQDASDHSEVEPNAYDESDHGEAEYHAHEASERSEAEPGAEEDDDESTLGPENLIGERPE